MSNVRTPGEGPQSTDPSINPLSEVLAEIRGLKTHIKHLELRFEYLDRDCLKAIKSASTPVPEHLIEEPDEDEEGEDTDREPEPHIPTLALTSDGRVLLSLHYVEGADLTDRERWVGIYLTEAESCDTFDRISEGADDAAAHVGGDIVAASKKAREASGE